MPELMTIIPRFIENPSRIVDLTHAMAKVPGETTAGTHGRGKKQSTMLTGPDRDVVCQQIAEQLLESEAVSKFCFTRNVTLPGLCRYDTDDYYDLHIDSPFMGGIRSDISFTAFLTPPTEYDGGELQLGLSGSTFIDIKPDAGTLVLYETGIPHRVQKIRSGSRVVLIGWIESAIRDSNTRGVLRDLYSVLDGIDTRFPDTLDHERFRLSSAITSILRMSSP